MNTEIAALADDYIFVCQSLNIISIFDATNYDRSDIDLMTPNMRNYIKMKLTQLGFKQISGNLFKNKNNHITCEFTKPNILMASPFKDLQKNNKSQHCYILTPTQTACQMLLQLETDQAMQQIIALIQLQPVNLYKIKDFCYNEQRLSSLVKLIPELSAQQNQAIKQPKLSKKRSL